MKVYLGSLALLLAVVDARTRIPRSLSKAALEATKQTPKLRKLELRRVRGLTEMIKKEGKLVLAQTPRSDRLRPDRKQRVLKQDGKAEERSDGVTGTVEVRDLQNNYNYNYNNGNNQNANNGNNQNANNNAEQKQGEGAEAEDNVWQYNWNYEGDYDLNENMNNEAVGFDMTSMSFHYTGCSAIKSWNDEMAQDENTDTVLMAQRMATFRLCPTAQCSSNTYNGCSSNYGDYVVSMDQFLLGMLAMQEDRVMGYCEYCQECANIESFKQFYSELEYRRQYLVQSSEKSYEAWVENYKANYANANANANNYWNYNQANGEGDANGNANQEQAQDDQYDDEYYQQLYYKKLTSGNYANNYVYGGNGAYQNYQNNNKYQGNGYQYNNQQQNYENYANNNNGQNNYNNGQYNYNNGYYNANNGNQAYGGNYGENQGQYGYQNQNGQYYQDGQNAEGEPTDDQIRANTYQQRNAEKWQMWDSFNMNIYGEQRGGDYQMYQQMYKQMQGWSGIGAWYGHRVVNGHMTYDNGVATWEAGWGFIGSDGEFYSLEATKDAVMGTDWGYELPEEWEQWLQRVDNIDKLDDALESCSYENAGSCYNQFFACMQVLGDDTYDEYVEQFNEQLYEEMFEDAARERFMASMTDYLECTKVDFDVDWNGNGNNQNQNNQNNQNQQAQQEGDYEAGYANGQWQAYEGMNYQGQWEQYRQEDGDLEFYIGPHCDGDKISLGVYTDEYCSSYASGIDIEDLLGFNPMADAEDDFELVPTECVSCAYDEVRRLERKGCWKKLLVN
jgi:hypothetical protein